METSKIFAYSILIVAVGFSVGLSGIPKELKGGVLKRVQDTNYKQNSMAIRLKEVEKLTPSVANLNRKVDMLLDLERQRIWQ